jgi:hypothetical protein
MCEDCGCGAIIDLHLKENGEFLEVGGVQIFFTFYNCY